MPSSLTMLSISMPVRSLSASTSARAHAPLIRPPNGECTTTRASPTASKKVSTMMVSSEEIVPSASTWLLT